MRQAEEAPGFFGNVCEVDQTKRVPDHVEQIAIFTRGRVLPFTGNAFYAVVQPDEHRPASGVSDIANLPVIALFAPIRKIVTAHRLSLSAETLRQATWIHTRKPDGVLVAPMGWRLGYHAVFSKLGVVRGAFGHFGYNGSGAWASPRHGAALGYVVNAGSGTPVGDWRMIKLTSAALSCIRALRRQN